MCVILVCDKKRPTDEMVEKAYAANDHGAGIAWREDSDQLDDFGKPRKIVKWSKGLDLETVKELIHEVPLPFVAHFRIASTGGQRPVLTHPFPVDVLVPPIMDGETFGYVLFHNGHWGKWRDQMFDIARGFREKIPNGKWSDSRALAWFAAHYGIQALECVEEKIVAFSPDELEIFSNNVTYGQANSWQDIDGITCSNNFFETRGQAHTGGSSNYGNYGTYQAMCRDRTCTRKDIDEDGYCPTHQGSKPAALRAKAYEETKRKEAAQEQVTQKANGKTETPGGASTETPFVPAGVVTLERYEELYKAGRISKQGLKQARKMFSIAKQLPAVVN